jgi:hypothetical protein
VNRLSAEQRLAVVKRARDYVTFCMRNNIAPEPASIILKEAIEIALMEGLEEQANDDYTELSKLEAMRGTTRSGFDE